MGNHQNSARYPVWRPSLRQLIALTCEVNEVPEAELATLEVLRRARLALAAPNAEIHGGELYLTTPEKAAAFAGQLLANPPLSAEAPRLACQAMRGFLRRNGWRWDLPVPTTILRFQAEIRSGEVGQELADWIIAHCVEEASSGSVPKPPNWMSLFDDETTSSHVLYHAGPVAELDSDERELQVELGAGIEGAVADVAAMSTTVLSVQYPSVELSAERAPELTDYELWRKNRRVILGQADALLVTDVGAHGPGVGAAMEIDLMAAQGGPILYLRSDRRSNCSRYLLGRSDELDLTIHDYRSPADAAARTTSWLTERANAIRETGRRREDRCYENELLLRRFVPAFRRTDVNRRMLICGELGISPTLVEAAIEDPAVTSVVLGGKLASLCELVGLGETTAEPGNSEFATYPRAETLIKAAHDGCWDAATIQRLWVNAVREWETVGSNELRFAAQSVFDWLRRERESR